MVVVGGSVVVVGGVVVVVVVVAGGVVVVVVVVVVVGGGAAVVVVVGGGVVVVVAEAGVGATRGDGATSTTGVVTSITSSSISGLSAVARDAAAARAERDVGRTSSAWTLGSVSGLSAETAAKPTTAISITMITPAAEIRVRGRTKLQTPPYPFGRMATGRNARLAAG